MRLSLRVRPWCHLERPRSTGIPDLFFHDPPPRWQRPPGLVPRAPHARRAADGHPLRTRANVARPISLLIFGTAIDHSAEPTCSAPPERPFPESDFRKALNIHATKNRAKHRPWSLHLDRHHPPARIPALARVLQQDAAEPTSSCCSTQCSSPRKTSRIAIGSRPETAGVGSRCRSTRRDAAASASSTSRSATTLRWGKKTAALIRDNYAKAPRTSHEHFYRSSKGGFFEGALRQAIGPAYASSTSRSSATCDTHSASRTKILESVRARPAAERMSRRTERSTAAPTITHQNLEAPGGGRLSLRFVWPRLSRRIDLRCFGHRSALQLTSSIRPMNSCGRPSSPGCQRSISSSIKARRPPRMLATTLLRQTA